jgi:hypothetical protein
MLSTDIAVAVIKQPSAIGPKSLIELASSTPEPLEENPPETPGLLFGS